jgi:hypothetical protein
MMNQNREIVLYELVRSGLDYSREERQPKSRNEKSRGVSTLQA